DHHDEDEEEEDEDHHDEDEEEEDEDHHDEEGEDHDEEGEEHGHDDEEEIDRILLDSRRRNVRFTGGLKDLGTAVDEFVLKLSMTDWNHKEIEFFEDGSQVVGTVFDQQEFVYRGVFEQKKVGPLSGRFGIWGLDREYSAVGEEALSPPIDQTGFALFCPGGTGLRNHQAPVWRPTGDPALSAGFRRARRRACRRGKRPGRGGP
ncbi:MAG: hypothetical protein OXI92_12785, partial [Acidobacteriota bacterium]|nr:hypothetical protein [Acidobacteriota bacterium]